MAVDLFAVGFGLWLQQRQRGGAANTPTDAPLGDKPYYETEKERNPAQDKPLTKGEMKKLEKVIGDVHVDKKYGEGSASKRDYFKDKWGNIIVKPKGGGKMSGEPIGLNINDL